MGKYKNYLGISRYIFLAGPVFISLFTMNAAKYDGLILISLIIFINSQLRMSYLKNNLAIISILLESALVIYGEYLYGGFMFLIFFSTLIDISIMVDDGTYLLQFIAGGCCVYSAYISHGASAAWLVLMLYIGVLFLLMGFRKELRARQDTELLYDRIRKYSYELEGARARLMDYSRQVEKVTQLEERNRISRELHDSIGHSLAGLLMQVDACIQVMDIDRNRGMEILRSVYDNIKNSIDTVRNTVRSMKPEDARQGLDAIKGLIDKFAGETGIKVDFKIVGQRRDISPAVETALYGNIQEALTNSARYGRCSSISINLVYNSNSLEVFISDNGEGCSEIIRGLGLTGMEERTNMAGGSISFSGSNGFHIHMILPGGE